MPAPTGSTATVLLRPATDDDHDFLVELYGSTRDAELSQVAWEPGQREAFVHLQYVAQDTSYRAQNPHASFDVVEVGGQPAGRLYVDRRPGEIRVVDLSLLPQHRGAGIGTSLLRSLQQEAATSGRILTIHVEVHNPAARLYERLGFLAVAEQGLYRRMEWRPGCAP